MNFLKRLYLTSQIRKNEKILLNEGIKTAKTLGKIIQIGGECPFEINNLPSDRIYLPQNSVGQIDISPLLVLGAENHPNEARRYISYERLLNRLNAV